MSYEAAVVRLRSAIKHANDPQQSLPFPEEGSPVEEWRAVTLDQLEISGKLAESLTEAGLTTLGAIADYTATGRELTEITGIGPKAAEKIDAATEDWWKRHPGVKEPHGEEASTEAEAGESSDGAQDDAHEDSEE